MSNNSYESILDRQWDDVPEPKVLPKGTWLIEGRGAKKQAATENASERINFLYVAKEPLDDVDADELAKLGADYDFSMKPFSYTIWLDSVASLDKVRKFLTQHGIDLEGMSPRETIENIGKLFRGAQVTAHLDTRTYQDKGGNEAEENVPSQFAPLA